MNIFADMAVIRLTKEFSFEAAHALDGYDGPCREIHGHSYRLFVTVKGCPADDDTNPKCGMVMDFGVLKALSTRRSSPVSTMRSYCGRHAATLPCGRCWPNVSATSSRWITSDVRNMLGDFAARIARRLPRGVELHSLRLHETATSFAEWFAEDNR